MTLRRGSRLTRSSSRRKTAWSVGPGDTSPVTLTGSGSTILGAGVVPTVLSSTIVRIRGLLGLTLVANGAVGDGYVGAVGIGLVTSSAFAIGITALPTPITDVAWNGWMWHQFIDLRAFAGQSGSGSAAIFGFHKDYEVDSKAMRKFPDAEFTMVAIIEVVESGTSQLEVSFDSRILGKLA